MSSISCVGTQWGDEGKGKVVDIFAQDADVVIRHQGGDNAGHTLIVDGVKIVLHITPAGILHKHTKCMIGPGVVINPISLMNEIRELNEKGIETKGRLYISPRATLIMTYHKIIDALREQSLGGKKIGTTGRGIGPAYQDLFGRTSIQVSDVVNLSDQELMLLIKKRLHEKNGLIKFLDHDDESKCLLGEDLYRQLLEFRDFLQDEVVVLPDMALYLIDAYDAAQSLLFEGAQGTFLDIINGTRPFVTSSITTTASVSALLGFPASKIDQRIGIAKAYCTRVGSGPFPTEYSGDRADALQRAGNEFGATTGRPRRCGAHCAAMGRSATVFNDLTGLIITKIDTLEHVDSVDICDSYQYPDGTVVKHFPSEDVASVEAIINHSLPSWIRSDHDGNKFIDPRLQTFHETLQACYNVPIIGYSNGPDRRDMIFF
jgi:adenylosuccinate synthase